MKLKNIFNKKMFDNSVFVVAFTLSIMYIVNGLQNNYWYGRLMYVLFLILLSILIQMFFNDFRLLRTRKIKTKARTIV